MLFSLEILDLQHCKLATLGFFIIRCLAVAFKEKQYFLLFTENINGSSGMVLCNLLWSIFSGPYAVKYFVISICVTVCYVLAGEYSIIWRVGSDFSQEGLKSCKYFSVQSL